MYFKTVLTSVHTFSIRDRSTGFTDCSNCLLNAVYVSECRGVQSFNDLCLNNCQKKTDHLAEIIDFEKSTFRLSMKGDIWRERQYSSLKYGGLPGKE